jgi:hypothetical protein
LAADERERPLREPFEIPAIPRYTRNDKENRPVRNAFRPLGLNPCIRRGLSLPGSAIRGYRGRRWLAKGKVVSSS